MPKALRKKRSIVGVFICYFLMLSSASKAQMDNYNFTQSSGPYNSIYSSGLDIMNGSNYVFSTSADDEVGIVNIPFFFYVNGTQYYQLNLSTNGFITFGAIAPSNSNYTPISSLGLYSAAFSAFGVNMEGTGFRPRKKLEGLAPNRIFTIEFKDFKRSIGEAETDNFQIKLYETSNKLEVIYGTCTIPSGSTGVQVGVRGIASTDYKNRSGSNWGSTSSGGLSISTVSTSSSNKPDSGLTFTYTPVVSCSAPSNSAGALTLLNITNSIIEGTYLPSIGAAGYVVIRTPTSAAPQTPVNGQPYSAGQFLFGGGYVEYFGPLVAFVSSGLKPNTQYWYWIYPYSASGTCSTFPVYKTSSVSTATATTTACSGGTVTNSTTITTSGVLSLSALLPTSWSELHLPLPCENVVVYYNVPGAANESLIFNIDLNFSAKNLSFINQSTGSGRKSIIVRNISGKSVMVDGDLSITCPSTNTNDSCMYASQGLTIVTGNTIVGGNGSEGYSMIGSNNSMPEQTMLFKGDVTFGNKGSVIDEHTVMIMDGSTQTITNNSSTTPVDAVRFDHLRIGNGISTPTVTFAGSNGDAFLNDKGGVVDINTGTTLNIPATYNLNTEIISAGDYNSNLVLKSGAFLKLGGHSGGKTGSNFPNNYTGSFINSASTIEYNGSNAITQTVFATNYGNLILSNGSGSGKAAKISSALVNSNTQINIKPLTDFTLGAALTSAGPLVVETTGGLYCGTNLVTGTGNFTLNNLSFLGIGHTAGISTVGNAVGNIQMTGGRVYSKAGNYIYNGTAAQVSGNGLPDTTNNLTIDNPTTVTVNTSQIVNGVNGLQQGVFDIGSTKITINGTGTISSNTGKMKASAGIVDMKGNTGSAQLLSGNWFTGRNISTLINSNTTGITLNATAGDTLCISSALLYGTGTTSSLITTNDNLTLLSTDTATARFGNMTGNSITGKVNVERFLRAIKSWRLLATPVAIGTSQSVTASWRETGASTSSTGYGTQITGPAHFIGMDNYTQRASMKYYNSATNNFTDVTNSADVVANDKGYFVFVRGDRAVNVNDAAGTTRLRIKGDLRTGDQVFIVNPMTFESFGNPYASRIDFRTVTKGNIANSYTAWNPLSAGLYNVGAYETYTWDGTNYVKPGGIVRNFIESGEAVYVQSNSASAGSVTVKEMDKGTGSGLQSRGGVTMPTLEMDMYTTNPDGSYYLADGLTLNFSGNYSNQIDNNDVRKFGNISDNISIQNVTTKLSTERKAIPIIGDTIKLFMSGLRTAAYRFIIDPAMINLPGLQPVLIDKFSNIETPFSLGDSSIINFVVTGDVLSKRTDRFLIVFKQQLSVLPVNFISLKATRQTNKTVDVSWTIADEINVKNYVVERSIDGQNFLSIRNLEAGINNTSTQKSFIDTDATGAQLFYRIKAVSNNGHVQYSKIVKVKNVEVENDFSISPNPVTDSKINLICNNILPGLYTVQVVSLNGQIVHQQKINITESHSVKNIVPNNLGKGSFKLILSIQGKKKIVIPFVHL